MAGLLLLQNMWLSFQKFICIYLHLPFFYARMTLRDGFFYEKHIGNINTAVRWKDDDKVEDTMQNLVEKTATLWI